MIPIEQLLIVAAVLLLAGVLASKASTRLGIPALLLFLAIGMLAGSEGIGGIPFDDARLTQALGVVALAFILFAGGLDTNWTSVSRVFWRGVSLSTFGVLFTALITGLFVRLLLGVPWVEGLLLGSIVSSTDAAAVFAILRSRGVSLKEPVRRLLELESGSNDPMAVFLTLACIRFLTQPDSPVTDVALMFVQQMAVGSALGYGMGRAAVFVLNRLKLEAEGLYPVATVALVLLTYGVASLLNGNGYLSVYLAGMVMGNGDFIHKRSLMRFHDGLAWLMQISMFVVLGLLVFPSHLVPVAGTALLIAGGLIFVARPAGVFLGLAFARMGFRDKLLISWVGLRGAVPIVLATFPFVAGVPNADLHFNVVFFIVLASVLLQGTSINAVARWLGLQAPLAAAPRHPLDEVIHGEGHTGLVEIPVPEGSPAAGQRIVDIRLPKSTLIVLLARNGTFIVPRGSTIIEPKDMLWVLAEKDGIAGVRTLIEPGGPMAAETRGDDN
jgi:cell volume regulation protein A